MRRTRRDPELGQGHYRAGNQDTEKSMFRRSSFSITSARIYLVRDLGLSGLSVVADSDGLETVSTTGELLDASKDA